MSPHARVLLSAFCVLLPALRAAAEEIPLRIGATNKLDYRRLDPDDRRDEALRNRLEVTAHHGLFTAWVRLETLQLSDANVYDPFASTEPTTTGGEQQVDRTEVTRRAVTLDTDRYQVIAGDFTHVYGRGLALSVFEDEELNFDNRLEGVRGRVRHRLGTLTAVAGGRDGDRFRGLFAETRTFGPVRSGATFVEAWGSGEDTEISDREMHWGGFSEVTLGPASVYGEYVLRDFRGRDGVGLVGTEGHGGFVSALASLGSLTVSGEVRDMYRFEHGYNDPPTSLKQHPWTLLSREAGQAIQDIPDDDVKGYLGEAEYAAGLFTAFSASIGRVDADASDDSFWEAYGEAKTTWQEKAFFTAAAAESEFRIGTLFEERIGGFGEIVLDLDGTNSLTFGMEWMEARSSSSVTQDFEFPEEFHERIFSVSWGRSPWLQLTATYEESSEEDTGEPRDDWLSFLAEIAVADGHDVQLSYGSERGGWKCTGGVCFFEPEFEGLKVKWVGRY
ncbi:MAG TPA: DUF6029 family protein [bacterium]|nr:DUF6029 family protein [bacterium]